MQTKQNTKAQKIFIFYFQEKPFFIRTTEKSYFYSKMRN
jgi:hypothetical protein